ncbi:MAG: hypothetical protein A3E87_10275 [Gammaproteobacteria bacterium RIFCSPHIGHO2_12_FULL_35_23]|nr:MAG: hypothetical protein A3E87_10275 [Gammaproteobacteria bacterium RIFCSPHIGHO2_12_FULL_35_23]
MNDNPVLKPPLRIYFATLLGVFLQYFDYALYGFSTPYITRTFFPAKNFSAELILTWGIFAISFLMRPLGAMLFGELADKFGRRKVLPYTILLMSVATIAIGLLPTFNQSGPSASIFLILCLALQGLAVSTEYTGCGTYLLEFNQTRRGLLSGIITGASGIGICIASLMIMLFNSQQFYYLGGINWRWLFVIGGIVTGFLGVYLRHGLMESPAFLEVKRQHKIVRSSLWYLVTRSPKALIKSILISAYTGIAIIVIEVYLPSYFQTHFGIAKERAFQLASFLAFMEAIFAVFWGAFSDYIGYTKTLIIAGLLMLVGAFPLLLLFSKPLPWLWYFAASILAIIVAAADGPLMAFLTEVFPTEVRYTGVSLSYNLGAAVIGGLSPGILAFLQAHLAIVDLVSWYLILGATVMLSIVAGAFIVLFKEREKLKIENALHKQYLQEQNKFSRAVTQVAHDIRSPVSAIMMLAKECNEIPENQRNSLREAANRIQDIANYLLNRYGNKSAWDYEKVTVFLASTAVLSVLSEKRVEHRDKKIDFCYEFIDKACFSFIKANIVEFKRMLSNLINNAVDAISESGKITIVLERAHDELLITISDTGRGMPAQQIKQILNDETLISSKISGYGFGLSHAKETLRKFGAELKLHSELDHGTQLCLVFNLALSPVWIAHEIKVYVNDCVVVLDDDQSIHGAWDKVFSNLILQQTDIKIVHFTQGNECVNFIQSFAHKNRLLLLADYELIKQGMNGLDVIEISDINRSLLVTSHYENQDIIKRAILLNTKILPKILASNVQLKLLEQVNDLKQPAKIVNLVLLEDNKEFSEVLSYLYQAKNKKIVVYYTPYELLENLHTYPKETKICIDYSLDCPITGIDLAAMLYKKGYQQLYLATGFQINQVDLPHYLTLLKEKIELINL